MIHLTLTQFKFYKEIIVQINHRKIEFAFFIRTNMQQIFRFIFEKFRFYIANSFEIIEQLFRIFEFCFNFFKSILSMKKREQKIKIHQKNDLKVDERHFNFSIR